MSEAVSIKILEKKVRQILQNHQDDDAPISMKSVREQLEKDLGVSLASQRDDIKKILSDEMEKQEQGGSGNEEEEPVNDKKRKSESSSTTSDSKKVKQDSNVIKTPEGYMIYITDKKRVTINSFKGNKYVHVREYYEDKPTKKGMAMNMEEWKKFKSLVDTVDGLLNK